MLKKVLVVLLLCLCFCVNVSAESATVFTVNNAKVSEDTFSFNVTTDKPSGVGGIDMIFEYDAKVWELDENSIKCCLPNCEIVTSEGKIRVLWETIESEEFDEVLLSGEMKCLLETVPESFSCYLSLGDYYDNTVEVKDLPYEIVYASIDEVEEESVNNPWLVLVIIVAVIGLLAVSIIVYLYLQNKKIEKITKELATKE